MCGVLSFFRALEVVLKLSEGAVVLRCNSLNHGTRTVRISHPTCGNRKAIREEVRGNSLGLGLEIDVATSGSAEDI